MASMGPAGFKEVATRCYQNGHYLAAELGKLPGYSIGFEAPFFHEFVVRTPISARQINARLAKAGIIGGYDLANVDPALDDCLLLCATELNDKESIDRLIATLK
jgi:glycine dehydrogenase subunit 1